MLSKAERTTQFILETVAPIFNKKGYYGTSMSDLTAATGLTKGSIYGNFENKEQLALEAFNYNVRKVNGFLKKSMGHLDSPTEKLFALTGFYRTYHTYVEDFGGCPFINVGIDSLHQNPVLTKRVKQVIKQWIDGLIKVIDDGKAKGEFKKSADAEKLASLIFGIIEGGAFMTNMSNDSKIMGFMMDQADEIITNELIKK